jgi:septation ring formation regulator EzrA
MTDETLNRLLSGESALSITLGNGNGPDVVSEQRKVFDPLSQSMVRKLDNQIEEMNLLETEWQRIKDEISQSEWMARRVRLIQKDTLTNSEQRELAELNQMCDRIPTGMIGEQGLTRRLSHAVELLEKAAKSDPKGAGIPPAYLVPS